MPDEGDSCKNAFQCEWHTTGSPRLSADRRNHHDCKDAHACARTVDNDAACDVNETRYCRTDNVRQLRPPGSERERAWEDVQRNQRGKQRLLSRLLKRAHRAQTERREQDDPAPKPAASSSRYEQAADARLHHETRHQHAAPIATIRDLTYHETQCQGRHELRESDHAEVEGAMGDAIHLPSDDHHEHLRGVVVKPLWTPTKVFFNKSKFRIALAADCDVAPV